MPERDSHIVATILVADLVGSSKFIGIQKDLLFKAYHDQIDNLFKLNNYQSARLKSETAGDGLHIVFSDAVAAGNYALELVNFIKNYDWSTCGVNTTLGIRIALHTGIVYRHRNPVTNTFDYSGHVHDLVSRLEPITARNEIFVTQNFAVQCILKNSNLYFTPVGKRSLKKSAGNIHSIFLYRLRRSDGFMQSINWDDLSRGHAAPFKTDADWSWLISLLHSNRVIPVIGPELLRVKVKRNGITKEVNLYDYAVRRLANELEIYYSENMSFVEIFDLCEKKYRNQTEVRFKEIIETLTDECDPPDVLQRLVAMRCFPGFIVTTPDSFLKKAMLNVFANKNDDSWLDDWELFAGEKEFKGRDLSDISAHTDSFSSDYPFIFHIFGMLNSHSDFYAITENDMLMFARAWNQNAPANLKKYLHGREENERKVILLLGCNYENWYARLFLFNLSAAPTCATLYKDCGIVADNISRNDSALGMFLARDNYGKVFYNGDATDFINIMAEKYLQKQQQEPEWRQVSGVVVIAADNTDSEIATALREQLKSVNFKTKLISESEMQNPQRMEMILANAAVFIPVVSVNSSSLLNIIKIGYEENLRRKNSLGKDYFIMPLFASPNNNIVEVCEENRLHINNADMPLDNTGLKRIYQNLCTHEER